MLEKGHELRRETRQELTTSDLDVEQVIAGLSPEVQASAREAAVLLFPTDFGPEHPGGYFPNSTHAVFAHLRSNLPPDLSVDAAVDDERYAEYSYHSADIILPVIYVAEQAALPLVVALLANWVATRRQSHRQPDARSAESDTHVDATVHVESSTGRIRLRYRGPADRFENTMTDLARRALGDPESDSDGSRS